MSHEHEPLRLLKVFLGDHCFGIDILTVENVIKRMEKTPVPLAAPYVTGVLNLRGQVVTEVDVAQVLDIAPPAAGEAGLREYALIISRGGVRYSMVFDRVGEVFPLDRKDIAPLPETIEEQWQELAQGVCRMEEGLVVLLDLKHLIDHLSEQAAKPVSTASGA